MRHLDDVLQLARLLLHFGSQEQAGQGDGVPVEALVGVEHVEAIRVHDRCVNAKLRSAKRKNKTIRLRNYVFGYNRLKTA